jgi:hypothetical protein
LTTFWTLKKNHTQNGSVRRQHTAAKVSNGKQRAAHQLGQQVEMTCVGQQNGTRITKEVSTLSTLKLYHGSKASTCLGTLGRHLYMDAEIVITSLNGEPTASDSASGKNTMIKARLKAARATMEAESLMGDAVGRVTSIPSGNKPALFPVQMPKNHQCWVLGWIIITGIWPQSVNTVDTTGAQTEAIIWMLKLQNATSLRCQPTVFARNASKTASKS